MSAHDPQLQALLAVRLAAEYGFYVFPVDHPTATEYCTGIKTREHNPDRCTERGKHPCCKWSEWSTNDGGLLVRDHYFGGRNAKNIGIDCRKSGLLVLDEDALEELARFCTDHDVELPATFTVRTANGFHYYFRQLDGERLGNREGLFRGYKINVRGAGGYVVGPGSLHFTGLVYAVQGVSEITPLPLWVVEALKAPEAKATGNGGAGGDAWWRVADSIEHPKRHEAMVAAAGWCRRMGLKRDEAIPVMRDVFARVDLSDGKYAWEACLGKLDDVYARYEAGYRFDVGDWAGQGGAGAGNGAGGRQESGQAGEDGPSTWTPIDLTDAYQHGDLEPAWTWRRSDGVNLVYRARLHSFHGASESCKSLAAQSITADELLAGHNVLYVDFEDDDRGMAARLQSFRVPLATALKHLTYIRPDEPLRDRRGGLTRGGDAFNRLLTSRKFDLAVIDGVTEAMVTEGLKMLDNDDIAQWLRVLPKKLTAAGAAVIIVDHVPKTHDSSSRFAIGGQHKLAGLTGAGYLFEVIKPLTRATGSEVQRGMVRLTVTKDRPAYVRAHSEDGVKPGILHLEAFPDGSISMVVQPERAHDEDAELREAAIKALAYLDLYPGASQTKVEVGVEGRGETIRRALVWAAEQGWLTIATKGNSHSHTLTPAGLDALDRSRRQ